MGGEFGQTEEWNFQQSLDWHLLQYNYHKGIQQLVADLNAMYQNEPALYQKQFSNEGFEWIDYNDAENSVLAYIRKGEKEKEDVIIICNMTPIPRENYRIGLPHHGKYKLIFNSDSTPYGGSDYVVKKQYTAEAIDWQYRKHSALFNLPPLAMIALKRVNSK